MKTRAFNVFLILCLVAQLFGVMTTQAQSLSTSQPLSGQAEANPPRREQAVGSDQVIGETDPYSNAVAVYIVRLAGEPLAAYAGGLDGLAATSPAVTRQSKLDLDSRASSDYRTYLNEQQTRFSRAAEQALSRPLDVLYRYDIAFNGLSLRATPAEAARLLKLPGVAAVYRDTWSQPQTDYSIDYLGISDIWDGSAFSDLPGTKGEGIIVGVIDSGVWPEHPSFQDDGSYPPPPAKWKGTCVQPADDSAGYACSNKLIGMQYFLNGYIASSGEYDGLFNSARDDIGHGTHTASTAAGNEGVNAYLYGNSFGQVSGVAPRAHLAIYKALGPQGGLSSDIVAAINQAVADGVDVINYSAGAMDELSPWIVPEAMAYLNARAAGIFVAVSAGNYGPMTSSLTSPATAPWVVAVGASYDGRLFGATLTLSVDQKDGSPLTTYTFYGNSVSPALDHFNLVNPDLLVGLDPEYVECSEPFPSGTFQANDIVLCPITTGAAQQAFNVKAGGGGAVIHYQGDLDLDPFLALQSLPGIIVNQEDAEIILDLTSANPGAAIWVDMTQGEAVFSDDPNQPAPDLTVAGFSSRGPNWDGVRQKVINVLKPDLTAPGVQILAGASPQVLPPDFSSQYFQPMQGTSMATPHVAGMGALIKSLHPDWTPAEIQSALMLTAYSREQSERVHRDVDEEIDGYEDVDATPFAYGAGLTEPADAVGAGFVLDESPANYLAADPTAGGDPASLNLPSLVQSQCLETCTWKRTVRSVAAAAVDWSTEVSDPNMTISPDHFTLAPGATQELTVQVNLGATGADMPFETWFFGEITFSATDYYEHHFTLAAQLLSGVVPEKMTINTRRNAGQAKTESLLSGVSGPLTVTTYSSTWTETGPVKIVADYTTDDPYATLDSSYYTTLVVPADAKGLEVGIVSSTARNANLYVGRDFNGDGLPQVYEQMCASANNGNVETCALSEVDPRFIAGGTYWILIVDYIYTQAEGDEAVYYTGLFMPDGGSGALHLVTPPANVNVGEAFTLDLSWDVASFPLSDRRYLLAVLSSGTTTLGETLITLARMENDVRISGPVGEVIQAGETIPLKIEVLPDPAAVSFHAGEVTYTLVANLPDGFAYVPGSASLAPKSVSGSQITWELPMGKVRHYALSTNQDDATCSPRAFGVDLGRYVPLSIFTPAIPSLTGTFVNHVDAFVGGTQPFNFYGVNYSKLYFTNNGYLVPAESAPANTGANAAIPGPAEPNNLLALLWRDQTITYDASLGSGVRLINTFDGKSTAIEYQGIHSSTNPAVSLNMEAVFRRQPDDAPGAHEILYAYNNVNLPDGIGTIGVENGDGSAGTQFGYNNLARLQGLMICYDWTPQREISLQAQIAPTLTASGPVTAVARVTHTAEGSLPAEASAEIQVSDVILALNGQAGAPLTPPALNFDLIVHNNGTGSAQNVRVIAGLPLGTQYKSGGSYNASTGQVSWTPAAISSGGSAQVSLAVDPLKSFRLAKTAPVVPAGAADFPPVERIIGGRPAKIADFPFQVALLSRATLDAGYSQYQSLFCGGVLIDPGWVLTAAHCVAWGGSTDWPGSLAVLAGADLLDDGIAPPDNTGTLANISQIIVHPQYDYQVDSNYDLALLRLKEPLTLSDTIQTVRVAGPGDAPYYAPGRVATDIGWGKTRASPVTMPQQLQQVELSIYSNEVCSQLLTTYLSAVGANPGRKTVPISQNAICAGAPTSEKSVCQGDSGGPMLVRDGSGAWLVAGIHSWGYTGCAAPASVQLRVSELFEWIERSLNTYTLTAYATNDSGYPGTLVGMDPVVIAENYVPDLQQVSLWKGNATQHTFNARNGSTVQLSAPASVADSANQVVFSPLAAPLHPGRGLFQPFYLAVTRESVPLASYTFAEPVTLTIQHDALARGGKVSLLRWDGTAWTSTGISIQARGAASLTVTLTQPGEYALRADYSNYLPAAGR